MDASRWPESARPVASELFQGVCRLKAKWQVYQSLFGATKERVDLLNRVAPFFFATCQKALESDILLSLCRLTDPADTFGYENLSLDQLFQQLRGDSEPTGLVKLSERLSQLHDQCDGLRQHRSKRLAHTDYGVAVGQVSLSMPETRLIDSVISEIADIFFSVADEYDPSTQHDRNVYFHNDVDTLVEYLSIAEDQKLKGHQSRNFR
jgi:hypothetical protein